MINLPDQELLNKYVADMKKAREIDDVMDQHFEGLNLLCELLERLGYKAVVEEFDKLRQIS
jgi:hypothetical protein